MSNVPVDTATTLANSDSVIFSELAHVANEAWSIDPDAPYAPKPWEEIIQDDHPVGTLKNRQVKQLYALLQRRRMFLEQMKINLLRRAASEGKPPNHPDYARQSAEYTKMFLMNGIIEKIYGVHLRFAMPEIATKPTVDLRVDWQVVWRDGPNITPTSRSEENGGRPELLN